MNLRNYSELSEEERNELFKQYKKKKLFGLNISLAINTIFLAVALYLIFTNYNRWDTNYGVNDLVGDYIKDYLNVCIAGAIIYYIIVLVINIYKRRKLKKVYTPEFQKYLYKKNILLDSINTTNVIQNSNS